MKTINQKEIAVLEKEIAPIVKKAVKIEIKNQDDMRLATEALSQLNQKADALKKAKEKITIPANAALRAVRELFKPIEQKMDEGIQAIRKEMGEYQGRELERAKEEEAKIVSRVGEGKGKLKVETAVKKLEEMNTPEAVVSTDSGMVKFKPQKKFEVMDITMLPSEFLLPNEKKIREAMYAGIELKGVRYFIEQVPLNFR